MLIMCLHYITVYHLHQPKSSIVTRHVESLRLDVRRVHALPFEVISLELSVWRLFGLVGDGLDC